jgi:hypothetical protein
VRLLLEPVALQLPDTMVGYLYSSPSLLFGPLAYTRGCTRVVAHTTSNLGSPRPSANNRLIAKRKLLKECAGTCLMP